MTGRDDLTNHGSGSGCCAGKRSNTDRCWVGVFQILGQAAGPRSPLCRHRHHSNQQHRTKKKHKHDCNKCH